MCIDPSDTMMRCTNNNTSTAIDKVCLKSPGKDPKASSAHSPGRSVPGLMRQTLHVQYNEIDFYKVVFPQNHLSDELYKEVMDVHATLQAQGRDLDVPDQWRRLRDSCIESHIGEASGRRDICCTQSSTHGRNCSSHNGDSHSASGYSPQRLASSSRIGCVSCVRSNSSAAAV